MKTKFFYLACLLMLQLAAKAQMKIGDNSTTINNASLLELETTNKGFVLPRVSITNVSAASPLPAGLLTGTVVFNTNVSTTGGSGAGIYYWDGSKWNFIANTTTTASYWSLSGNSGTSAATNFLGTTDSKSMRFRTNNVQRMIIDSVGKVGIGLNNPSYALSVLSASNPLYLSGVQATSTFTTDSLLTIYNGVVKKAPYSSLNNNWSVTGNSGTDNSNFLGTKDNVSMRFRTNNLQRMIIDSLGRVGIGLSNPSYALSVLSVSNPLYLSGLQTTSTPTADSVLTINAGVVKKTSYSTLTENFWSLNGNAGTNSSNFLGTTDGVNLQFKVNKDLSGLIDFSNSITTFGYQAGLNNGSVTGTTAFGWKALTSNAKGDNNTAVGNTSMSSNVSGASNTAIGYNTLANNDGGNNNTALGNESLLNNTASDNTAGGYLSLNSNIAGQGNTAFGVSTLITNTKGDYNTAIGFNADVLKDGFTNATAIGYNAKAGASNTVILGSDKTDVGIGTSAPARKLEVAGSSSTIRLGGLAFGGAFNNASTATTSNLLYTDNSTGDMYALPTVNSGILVTDVSGIPSWSTTALSSNAWLLTGNSGTSYATNFLGTKDNVGLRFRTNNTERMLIDSLGRVAIGTSSFGVYDPKLLVDNGNSSSNTVVKLNGNINDYVEINIQNKNSGSSSSSDYVATANDGTDSTNYIDMGINSSTYAPSVENFGGPHDGYLYTYSRNLLIGTASTSDVIFLLGGGKIRTNAIMRLNASDNAVVIGKGDNAPVAVGATVRGPNVQASATNAPGGNLTLLGGNSNGTATGGALNLAGGNTSGTGTGGSINITGGIGASGPNGAVNINVSAANPTNINTGISGSNVTIGSTGNNILLPKFATVGGLYYTSVNTGQVSTTGSNMTWDSINNRLGIGISNPGYKLSVLSSADPLYLSGVQPTSTFSSDSILTINAGVVKKAAYSSLTGGNNWSLTGNSGTTAGTNFIGTTDAIDFVAKTNNAERIRITSGGMVGIGTSTPASNLTVFQSAGSGSSKGFTFTGNSISGTGSGTGFLMSLGYNTTGNKQLWLGDGDYAGNASGSFARFVVTGAVFPVFDAVSGDGLLRRYLAFGVAGDANSGVIFGGDNTNVKPGSQVWDNGNMTIGNGYKSYAAPSNGLLVQGNVGIGTASPSSALSVIATSNPLYLSGVQATSTFTTDSVLTINAGVVKKTPYSSLSSGSSGWSLTGNSGTSAGTNFLGTTDAQPLIIKSLNRQLAYFDGNLYSIALGYGAVNSSSDHNVAIGYNASTNNQYALALGYSATASGVRSIAIGNGAVATTASGAESIAMGYNTTSSNVQSTAIGYQATASGAYGVALGYSAQATASQSTAIGYSALASAQYTNAIGYQAQATGLQSTAIGYHAQTAQTNTILLGDVSTPNLYVGIGTATPTAKLHIVGGTTTNYPLQMTGLPTGVAGTDNILTINSSGVVGSVTAANFSGSYWSLSGNAAANGSFLGTTNTTPLQFKFNSTAAGYLDANNTALGTSSAATSGSSNTAIGYSSTASNSATAVGANAVASQAGNTAIGNSSTANVSSQATAIGASSQALFQYNTAVGYNAQATVSSQETVIGSSAQAQGQNNIAIGYSAKANGSDKMTVVGSNAQASFQNNTVVGSSALATTNNQATAIGATAVAQAQNATALGYGASATGINSTAIGSSASTSQTNALVLGTSTTNVGIGTSTPNTSTKLDVAGYVKIGSNGTVTRNVISLTNTISSVNIPAQYTATTVVFTPNVLVQNTNTNYIDVTFTLPAAATNTTATVIVSPSFDLPDDIVIAFARLTSATQGKIRFLNIGTSTRTLSGTVSITVIDF